MITTLTHKEQTDKEFYEALKKANKERPDIFMNPEKWKKMRLKEIKIENEWKLILER